MNRILFYRKEEMKKYLGIAAISLSIACNNTNSPSTTTTTDSVPTPATATTSTTPVSFTDPKLEKIYVSYLGLKDALVATKADEAKALAKTLAEELKTYSGCENTAVIAKQIENAKDIATQRKDFTGLSTDLIALFKHADLKTGKIYVQHCPMANNGDGGDWLAAEKEIKNPYYGDEMLACGSVIEEIKLK